MGRHISFWIGFFAAALLIVPIALFAWGLAQDRLFDLLAMVFGAIAVIVIGLILVLLFRGPILRKMLGRGEASVDEMTRSLVAGVSAAATGDIRRAEGEADTLARVVVGWYAWSNFYRWVIASGTALLLVFGGFVGSVLLFEQTKKIGLQTEVMEAQTRLMEAQTERLAEQTQQAQMQNELAAVSLVTNLRQQILSTARKATIAEYLTEDGGLEVETALVGDVAGSCKLGFNDAATMSEFTSDSTQLVIADQAVEGLTAERIRKTLQYLVRDSDPSVALSALVILDGLGFAVQDKYVELERVVVEELQLTQGHLLSFDDSIVQGLHCPTCEIKTSGSFFVQVTAKQITGWNNLAAMIAPSGELSGIWVSDPDAEDADTLPPLENPGPALAPYGFFAEDSMKVHLTSEFDGPDDVCPRITSMISYSSIFQSID